MPAIDQDGLSPDELAAVRAELARDPDLGAELDLIVPALAPATRSVFWHQLAAGLGRERPAAAVLTALVAAARRRL